MSAPVSQCQPKALELRQDCPTPWQVAFAKHGNMTVIHGGQDHDGWQRVALVYSEKDAAFIVTCVNSHASLKARIEELEAIARQSRAAMLRTRAASIGGCEQGYGSPETWADELFQSHGGLTAAIKRIDAALPQSSGVARAPTEAK